MPCLNLSTNVSLDGVDTSSILSEATKTVAKLIGKPEAEYLWSLKLPGDEPYPISGMFISVISGNSWEKMGGEGVGLLSKYDGKGETFKISSNPCDEIQMLVAGGNKYIDEGIKYIDERMLVAWSISDGKLYTIRKLGSQGTYFIVLKGSVPMSFGGTEQHTTYGELVSIGGLNPDVNKKLSAAIAQILETKLSIPKSRFFLKFYDTKGSNFGWNGSTF